MDGERVFKESMLLAWLDDDNDDDVYSYTSNIVLPGFAVSIELCLITLTDENKST